MIRYEKAIIAMAKQRVTLEVLSYHATAPAEEANKLKVQVLSARFKLPNPCFFSSTQRRRRKIRKKKVQGFGQLRFFCAPTHRFFFSSPCFVFKKDR